MSMLKSYNPANGELVGELSVSSEADIATKVTKAKIAHKTWSGIGIEGRRLVIQKAYRVMDAQREVLAKIISEEMGKLLKDALAELSYVVDELEMFTAEIIGALKPQEVRDGNIKSVLYRDSYGVAACITPWNYPLLMPHELIIPSLMAGNTVIFKPSEETPIIGKLYVEILNSCLPKDVVQLVIGGDEQGRQLVNANVQLISFTGSREAGSQILQSAAKDLKRVILELSGKDPMIILDDADLEAAAKFAASSCFSNAGQVCVSTERIYVLESVADWFIEALKVAASKIQIGPMTHERQKAHVKKQVKAAIAAGASLIYGDPDKGQGNFLEPMILTNVNHRMSVMYDETFGPIACVMKVSNADEAVILANETSYGLGAVVFGENSERTQAIARSLTAGMVGINRACAGARGTPWVGAAQSGYGFHSSPEGHRQFAQLRVVSENL